MTKPRQHEPIVPDPDLLVLLGSIQNALHNGSHMTNANLAFNKLCVFLGVQDEELEFNPAAVADVPWADAPRLPWHVTGS